MSMAFSCSTDSREPSDICDDSLDFVTVNSFVPPDGYLGPLGRLLLSRRSHLIARYMCWHNGHSGKKLWRGWLCVIIGLAVA